MSSLLSAASASAHAGALAFGYELVKRLPVRRQQAASRAVDVEYRHDCGCQNQTVVCLQTGTRPARYHLAHAQQDHKLLY